MEKLHEKNVALFLVSDEASYVSGAVYSITGG